VIARPRVPWFDSVMSVFLRFLGVNDVLKKYRNQVLFAM